MRLVDRERAQHRRDVERRAREPLHRVGPAVGLGVEARRGDARVPAAVDAAEVDDAVACRSRARRTRRADASCRSRARGRSRCPRRSARSRAGAPVSAATPATSVTRPSPPHATRSWPVVGRGAARAWSGAPGSGETCSSTPARARGAFEVGRAACGCGRARRPGLTIAVHGMARRLRALGASAVRVRGERSGPMTAELDPATHARRTSRSSWTATVGGRSSAA